MIFLKPPQNALMALACENTVRERLVFGRAVELNRLTGGDGQGVKNKQYHGNEKYRADIRRTERESVAGHPATGGIDASGHRGGRGFTGMGMTIPVHIGGKLSRQRLMGRNSERSAHEHREKGDDRK